MGIFSSGCAVLFYFFSKVNFLVEKLSVLLNPFRAPEPLPILNPSNFVPKNGFPVVTTRKKSGMHD